MFWKVHDLITRGCLLHRDRVLDPMSREGDLSRAPSGARLTPAAALHSSLPCVHTALLSALHFIAIEIISVFVLEGYQAVPTGVLVP